MCIILEKGIRAFIGFSKWSMTVPNSLPSPQNQRTYTQMDSNSSAVHQRLHVNSEYTRKRKVSYLLCINRQSSVFCHDNILGFLPEWHEKPE